MLLLFSVHFLKSRRLKRSRKVTLFKSKIKNINFCAHFLLQRSRRLFDDFGGIFKISRRLFQINIKISFGLFLRSPRLFTFGQAHNFNFRSRFLFYWAPPFKKDQPQPPYKKLFIKARDQETLPLPFINSITNSIINI